MHTCADVVTRYLNSFAVGDPDVITSFVSSGFHNEHLSELGSSFVGRDEYRRRLPHFLDSFADRAYSVDDLIERDHESTTDVVVRYVFRATYEGHPIEIPGVMWFTVRNERITSRIDSWDSLTFLRQTGQA